MDSGLNTLGQAAVFVHLGRCGLTGASIPSTGEALGMNLNTVYSAFTILEDLKLAVRYAKSNRQGRCFLYTVTRKGWRILTEGANLELYPDAAGAIKSI